MTSIFPLLALLLTSVMLATVPIFTRLAQGEGLPTLAIATLRLLMAVILLTPYVLARYRDDLRRIQRRDLILIGLAGLCTTMFFVFFFNAIAHTTVLIAAVMNGTSPLWAVLVEVLILKVMFRRSVWIGLVLVLAGSILYAFPAGDTALTPGDNPILGGGLALMAALVNASYVLLVREIRRHVAILPFLWLMLVAALSIALVFALITQTPLTGFEPQGYLWVLLMTLCAQIIGHASLAYALTHVPATLGALTTQLAVIFSAGMALVLFQEVPHPLQIIASVGILAGVALVIFQPRPSARTAQG